MKKALALEEERIATSPFFTSAASLAALVKNLDLLEMIMNEKLDNLENETDDDLNLVVVISYCNLQPAHLKLQINPRNKLKLLLRN